MIRRKGTILIAFALIFVVVAFMAGPTFAQTRNPTFSSSWETTSAGCSRASTTAA